MPNFIRRKAWQEPESRVTPEDIYVDRRQFLRHMGFLGMAGLLAPSLVGCSREEVTITATPQQAAASSGFPAAVDVNPAFAAPGRPLTAFDVASRYNNFYEFTTEKERVAALARDFTTDPWSIEVKGLVHEEKKVGLEELVRLFPLEERIYRFRCVEAWAMTVPWIGFPLSRFIDWCRPLGKASHVRFVTVYRPGEMPGQRNETWYPWPYYEGLRMDEARNELALLTVGMYGRVLPNQNGAPVRLVVPWKYGYKSIKSIVKIEFLDEEPATFWNDMAPDEYGFYSNVDPGVPHPRWSQATETLIGTSESVPTRKYNGYGEWVAELYPNPPYF